MSVTANDRFKSTTGDGVTTTFDIDFPFADSSEVAVATVVDGVKTVLVSGYSITPTAKTYPSDMAYPGGTITFTTAPASGTIIQRYGITAQTQATTINPNATLFSSAVQNIVDKLTWLYQEAKRDLGFTVQVTPGTTQVTIPPISDGPGYVYTDGTNPYELVNELGSGSLVVSGDTAGYVPFWSGSATLTALINFFYVTATKTLRLRGSATATDNILLLQNSAAATLATFRADGVETATTDLTRKSYVDTASGNAAVLAKLLTGLVSGDGSALAATDTILQAFQKLDGRPRVLNRTTVPVSSAGTVLTELYSYTVPGNTIANRTLRVRANLAYSTDASAADLTHFIIEFGGTAYDITDWALQDNAAAYPFLVEVLVVPYNNATNAQRIYIFISFYDSGYQTQTRRTVTAIDTTADADFKIKAQWDATDADDFITLESAITELI